jgi:nucleoid-associated protein YgaU
MDRGATTPEAQGSGGSRTMHEPTRREWTVRRGDTLWDIAGEVLDTSDQARIARYWPAIHRANRETIGPDPSLLFPGQILSLPEEDNAR